MKSRKKPKLPRIRERHIIKELECLGVCWPDGSIDIDPRQSPRSYLDTLCHEVAHFCFPKLTEARVAWFAGVLSEAIWKQGYRKIEK